MDRSRIASELFSRVRCCALAFGLVAGCNGIDLSKDHATSDAGLAVIDAGGQQHSGALDAGSMLSMSSAGQNPRDAGSALLDSGVPVVCGSRDLVPPDLVLSSSAGDQIGALASYEVSCLDGPPGPIDDRYDGPIDHFNVVHSGDILTISMPDGTLISTDGCPPQSGCDPEIEIDSFCSMGYVTTKKFTEDQPWKFELMPGTYELRASTHFIAKKVGGGSGYVFGVIVDNSRQRAVVDVGAPGTTCDKRSKAVFEGIALPTPDHDDDAGS